MAIAINTKTGLIEGVRYVPSPNFDQRPFDAEVNLLVIHNISLPPGEFGGPYVEALFTNTLDPHAHPYFQEIAELKVSCHCFIRRTGEIIQFVPFHERAWHAGESSFEGREKCNNYSIGIELEGTDELPYTPSQYQALKEITLALQAIYPGITENRMVGHSTIAPIRKTDPGPAFDWLAFKTALKNTDKRDLA